MLDNSASFSFPRSYNILPRFKYASAKLGLNSIKRVEEHFNIDYCVSQYLKIYQSFNSLYER